MQLMSDLFAVFVMPIVLLGLMVGGVFAVMVAINIINNIALGKDWEDGQLVRKSEDNDEWVHQVNR